MSKIGIALSCYNKLDHLAMNIDVIRNHWKEKVYISVCCNYPDGYEYVKSLDIDKFVPGDDLPYDTKPQRRRRIIDCIEKSIKANEADYVVHWHSDAFAINYESLDTIVEEMKTKDIGVSFRGRGLWYHNAKCEWGDVDDHFLFMKQEDIDTILDFQAMEKHLQLSTEDFLKLWNPETFLSCLIRFCDNTVKSNHYSDMSECVVGTTSQDSFYEDNLCHRAMNPFNLDETRKFYHVGTLRDWKQTVQWELPSAQEEMKCFNKRSFGCD
jgi:hypothetical protein